MIGRSWILLAGGMLAGCATDPQYVVEHPVSNPPPPLKAGVFAVSAVDVRPVSTKEIEPDYPPELGSILTGGAVVVFTVRSDGKVTDPAVLQADDVLFGEAAVAAISKWRFHPAEIKGAPVDCRMSLPFVFDSPYGYYSTGGGPPTVPGGGAPAESTKTTVEPH